MESDSSNQMRNPKPLKTLASDVKYPNKNNILHQFVLDNSDPNNSVSQNCMNAVLVAMNGSALDVNTLNNDGQSPLYLAILNNNLLMVQKLLSCLVNIDVNARCHYFPNYTALHLAVKSGNVSIVQELLDKGADANIVNAYQDTALYFAVRSGNLDIVKLLVSKGANIDLINEGALHCAARSGNIEVVKYVVSNGADVNAKDDARLTPLHNAARSGDLTIVEFLVSQGADINAIDIYGESLLHDAARSGNLDIIKFLIDKGVNVNIESGDLPLCAAQSDNLGTMQFLIDKGADVNANDKACNTTPLHYAIFWCSLEGIKFLVDKGANVNAIDTNGQTPLHNLLDPLDPCVSYPDNKTDNEPDKINIDFLKVKLLLVANTDLNIEDNYGKTPLQYAVDFPNSDIVKLFLEREVNLNVKYMNGDTILHRACKLHDKLDIIEILLIKGCDVNAKNELGITPLQYAVDFTNSDIVKLFLEREVNLNVKYMNGDTILHRACKLHDKLDIIEILLIKGCDVNAKNELGITPLQYAVDFTNSDIVKLFLEREVDLYVKYINGDTILHRACKLDDKLDIIEILLIKGCDVNAKNELGITPLHAALYSNNAAYTKLLLERGASVNVTDNEGWTPLHVAAYKGHVKVIRALLDKGADTNAINKDGKTPLDLAKENNYHICIDALQ